MGKSSEKEEFWRLVLDEFRSSRLTVRAFCKREALAEASFYAWRKRLCQRDEARAAGVTNQPGKLIPVDIIDSSALPQYPELTNVRDRCEQATQVEVRTPCGFLVRANDLIEPSRLRKVLGVIVGLDREAEQC